MSGVIRLPSQKLHSTPPWIQLGGSRRVDPNNQKLRRNSTFRFTSFRRDESMSTTPVSYYATHEEIISEMMQHRSSLQKHESVFTKHAKPNPPGTKPTTHQDLAEKQS